MKNLCHTAKVPMDVSDLRTEVEQHLMTRMTSQNLVLHNFNGGVLNMGEGGLQPRDFGI